MGPQMGPDEWVSVLQACVPILVALVGIIPTIISTRKKTQDSIAETQDSIKQLQKTLDEHIKEDEAGKARAQRYRILNFYDELCENRKHSESHFEDILDDIDSYESYCNRHPDFRNNRGKAAMQYITDTYYKVKSKGDFLIHHEGE